MYLALWIQTSCPCIWYPKQALHKYQILIMGAQLSVCFTSKHQKWNSPLSNSLMSINSFRLPFKVKKVLKSTTGEIYSFKFIREAANPFLNNECSPGWQSKSCAQCVDIPDWPSALSNLLLYQQGVSKSYRSYERGNLLPQDHRAENYDVCVHCCF